jgi:hypothetical protein
VTGNRTLCTLPGGAVDQVARREQFERDHPDALIVCRGHWAGRLVVCRKRLEITRPALGPLLDGLDGLAALDAEAIALEAEFPGWRLWLSSVNRWWATRQGPDAAWNRSVGIPITIDADDLAGLRVELAAAQATADAADAAGTGGAA